MGGFTLLEVLVALAVLALAMAAITSSTSAAAANASHLRDRTLAHWVAVNKLTELQLQPEWPAAGEAKGSYEMANREWRWEMRVSDTDDPDVRRLDVKIFGGPQEREPLAVTVAYVDKPL
jgi:general secretion pathway protein I